MPKRNVDIRRRRIALAVCSLAAAVWVLFAMKEFRHEPRPRQADSCTRTLVLKHLANESRSPLFGKTNIGMEASDE